MYVYFRLLKVALLSWLLPKAGPLDLIRTRIRIWPNDLDFNWHLNNGRYLTLFDLGRMDLVMRTPLFKALIKNRWNPVLSTAAIRFRRAVPAFAKVDITTQVIWWDEKWIFIEHRLEKDGETYARALVKAIFRSPKGNVPTAELNAALGISDPAPPMPALVKEWREFEAELR